MPGDLCYFCFCSYPPFHSPCYSSVLALEHPRKAPFVTLKTRRRSRCHTRSFCVSWCCRNCDKGNDLGFKIKCSRAYAFLCCFCSSPLIAQGQGWGASPLFLFNTLIPVSGPIVWVGGICELPHADLFSLWTHLPAHNRRKNVSREHILGTTWWSCQRETFRNLSCP